MRLVADERVDGPIVASLRQIGYIVDYVAEQEAGLSDEDVLALARRMDAVLVTADSDFGELVFRQGRAHRGVLLLRLAGLDEAEKGSPVATYCVSLDSIVKLGALLPVEAKLTVTSISPVERLKPSETSTSSLTTSSQTRISSTAGAGLAASP